MEKVPQEEETTKLYIFEAMFIIVVALIVAGAFYSDEILSLFSK